MAQLATIIEKIKIHAPYAEVFIKLNQPFMLGLADHMKSYLLSTAHYHVTILFL
jgi:hypothetical protein